MPNEVLSIEDVLNGFAMGKDSSPASARLPRGWVRSGSIVPGNHSRGGFEFISVLVDVEAVSIRSL